MDQVPNRRAGDPVPANPTREEFRAWAERQPGRYELYWGEVRKMDAERIGHVRLKTRIWRLLDQAIREAGLDCEAMGDGVTVEIGDRTNYDPDALVNAGPPPGPDDIAAPNPVIVAEVASPSSQAVGTGDKLADDFRLPSIQHYPIVRSSAREVIHHARRGDRIEAKVVASGPLHLDPPGLVLRVEDIFADLPGTPR